jgi:DNA polymerase I
MDSHEQKLVESGLFITSRNGTTKRNAERVALNAPIQGLAADLIKIAMIRCDQYIKAENLGARMILQIHDELLFEVPGNEISSVVPRIREIMESALTLAVPLKVEIGYGRDWMDMQYNHPY